jgi:hypothetical protein
MFTRISCVHSRQRTALGHWSGGKHGHIPALARGLIERPAAVGEISRERLATCR